VARYARLTGAPRGGRLCRASIGRLISAGAVIRSTERASCASPRWTVWDSRRSSRHWGRSAPLNVAALREHPAPLNVAALREHPKICDAFIEAAVAEGFLRNPDYNSGNQDGFGYYQAMQKNGRRWSTARAFSIQRADAPTCALRRRLLRHASYSTASAPSGDTAQLETAIRTGCCRCHPSNSPGRERELPWQQTGPASTRTIPPTPRWKRR
jgi:hypothetical protein